MHPILNPEFSPHRAATHILCVDDFRTTLKLLTRKLVQCGFSIKTASNGREAIDVLSNHPVPFDVIITDHHMPEMDGLEFVRLLNQYGFAGKIIVLSAGVSHAEMGAYAILGVSHFLRKPLQWQDLIQALGTDLEPQRDAARSLSRPMHPY
jgi:CheY-like chemotaxis protein